MSYSERRTARAMVVATSVLLVFGGLLIEHRGSRAADQAGGSAADPDDARQVTVFGIIAKPGESGIDAKLSVIKPQLVRLLPNHGFKILDVQSKRLIAGEMLESELGKTGYAARTSLIKADDENGKVELRCELWTGKVRQFSTQVKTPPNQLFFCERVLKDGSRLLIGIGAR